MIGLTPRNDATHGHPNDAASDLKALSSSEIESLYPHVAPVIRRGAWTFREAGDLSAEVERLGDCCLGDFNNILRYRFARQEQAVALSEYALSRRLNRLVANSTHGASREEVALEWERIEAEREEILAWGRVTGMLRESGLVYRFERHVGTRSYAAHLAAARLIAKSHPTIVDPFNYAGVLIEWSEREHRSWFWRCCRSHHVL